MIQDIPGRLPSLRCQNAFPARERQARTKLAIGNHSNQRVASGDVRVHKSLRDISGRQPSSTTTDLLHLDERCLAIRMPAVEILESLWDEPCERQTARPGRYKQMHGYRDLPADASNIAAPCRSDIHSSSAVIIAR